MVLVTGREWGCAGNLRICGGSDRGAFRPVVKSRLPVFPAVRRIEMSSVDVADDVAGDSSINCKSAWDTRALSVLLGVLLSAPQPADDAPL